MTKEAAARLTREKGKKTRFVLPDDVATAVEILKAKITEGPVMSLPKHNREFKLTTDASQYAIGGVLAQRDENGDDHPIWYASRTLTKTEQKYSASEREMLAVYDWMRYFRQYLWGQKFKVYTDHIPLLGIRTQRDVQGRLTRWILKLQEYDYELIYIPGKKNVVADTLSRKPIAKKNDGIDKIMAMINDEKEKHKEAEEEHRIVAGIKGKERKREKEERKTARELTNESVKKREEVEGEDLTEEEKGRAKAKKDKQIMGEKMTTRTRTRTARQLEKWAEGELDEEGQRDCIADMQMKDTTLETI